MDSFIVFHSTNRGITMDKLLMLPVFGMVVLTIGIALWMLKLLYNTIF